MKTLHIKSAGAVLSIFAASLISSCNKRQQNSHIQSDIENPNTSADTVTSYKEGSLEDNDSININNDAQRMSRGKDSVLGEITPPNASDQDGQ